MSNLLTPNPVYKPFRYPWAYEAWLTQNRIHWLPEEVPLAEDVKDWKKKLTDSERNLLTQIFRFFTQADIEVQNCYNKHYSRVFQPTEVQMMLGAFSAMECFDKDTELLTSKGWKNVRELTMDDVIAQYNLKTEEISFVYPKKVVKYPYQGKMVNYKNSVTDICVTPNHDMIVKNFNTKKIQKVKTYDLVINKSYGYPISGKGIGKSDKLTVLEKILIAVQADGGIRGLTPSRLKAKEERGYDDRTISFHLKKQRKINKIKALLTEAGIEYREKIKDDNFHVINFDLLDFDFTTIKNFDFLKLEDFSQEKAFEFYNEIIFWDGTINKNTGQKSYYNSNKTAIDKVQAICTLAGISACISVNSPKGAQVGKINPNSVSNYDCYVVSFKENKTIRSYPEKPTYVDYDDFVYCVSVDTENLISRRNNRVAFTGNTIHIAAYSHLLDTIGMPEVEYSAFLHYKEMKDKYDYMQGFNINDNHNIAKTLAVFGAFTEGLQLFASFAMLMNFSRYNKMKGMGQIVTWSVRDETLHCQNIIKLFRTFVHENPEIWTEKLREELLESCITIVEHEDAFIDLAFEMGEIEGLNAQGVKDYIRYIADRRLEQLGLDKYYGINKNPLPWMDAILNGVEHTNFFENRATEYSRASTQGDWEDAFTEDERNFVVYTKDNCPFCVKTKEFFNRTGYAYRIEDKSDDTERNEWYDSRGFVGKERTVPKIYEIIDGKEVLLGGSEILNTLLK